MTSTQSFTLFPYLPPELRLQIYRHACHPRVTTLTYLPSPHDTFHSPTPPPILLHISHESRTEGLRLYLRCPLPPSAGGSEDPEREEGGEGREERYIYHHPAQDTLYVPRPVDSAGYADWARVLFGSRMPGLGAAVRRLAVDYVPAERRRPWEVYGKVCLMRGCGGLEEAFLIVSACDGDGKGGGRGREIEFVDPRADDEEIRGVMERVRESFRWELGEGEALELVPKAKVVSGWAGCDRAVVCAS